MALDYTPFLSRDYEREGEETNIIYANQLAPGSAEDYK